jgi:tetratricopeptide (TPR) repeat protein
LSIADTLNNIGTVYADLSKHEDALDSYSKSLEIQRKIFGTDEHSSIADTLNNIGSVQFMTN